MSGANDYTGDTTISAGGTLQLTGTLSDSTDVINSGTYDVDATDTIQSLSGSGTVDLASGIVLSAGDALNHEISGVVTGSGGLTKTGSGTLTLSGANDYTGDTTISAGGTLQLTGTLSDSTDVINSGTYDVDATDTIQSLSGSGTVDLASGIVLSAGDALNHEISGVVAGAGGLTKVGSGTLTLSGANDYTGDTTISAGGTLQLTGTLSDSTDVINSGTYDVDATDTIQSLSGSGTVDIASGIVLSAGDALNHEISGVVAGAGGLTKTGSGTLTLSGANDYTGDTTISAGGTLQLTGTLSDSTDVINSGTYDVDATDTIQSLSGSGTVDIASGIVLSAGDALNHEISGVVAGAGGLTKVGSGTLTLSGANDYTGDTTISAGGTLQLTGTLSDSTDVINSGTYDVDATDTIQSLSGSGGVDLASGIVLSAGDALNHEISGVVTGAGGLTKTGSGTLTLSGANDYTGDTTISAGGTLQLTGTLSDSTDVINSGTYDVDATDTIQSLSGSGTVVI